MTNIPQRLSEKRTTPPELTGQEPATAGKGESINREGASRKPSFARWIARQVGSNQWVVARASARLRDKGYKVFLSPRRFTALADEYAALYGVRS